MIKTGFQLGMKPFTLEREYQAFCDRCSQHLDWSDYDNAEIKYIGWNGPEDN